MATAPENYPLTFSVDYPEKLNRLTTFFRAIASIPILVILGMISSGAYSWEGSQDPSFQYTAGGIVLAPLVLMILFRQKYPRWWYDWNLALTRFSTRVSCYLALLRDEYPSTDEEQAVHLDFPYPNVKNELNRWLPLVKWLLAIPHYVVLFFLFIGAIVAVIIAWFAMLFTGRYPRGLFDFVVGVFR